MSMCSLCGLTMETSVNLFLSCPFTCSLWHWLRDLISCDIDFSSFTSILNVYDKGWSSQNKDIILAAVLNIVWMFWHCRNKLRFHNKVVHYRSAISSIIAQVSLVGHFSIGTMSSSIAEFTILRSFFVSGHVAHAPSIKEVIWVPPTCNWVLHVVGFLGTTEL